MGVFAFLYCLAITEHPWVPGTGELWKRHRLDSVLECPKVSGVAGALKPYGGSGMFLYHLGSQFSPSVEWATGQMRRKQERGYTCKYLVLPVLSIGDGVVLAVRSPVWGHRAMVLSASHGPCPPPPPPPRGHRWFQQVPDRVLGALRDQRGQLILAERLAPRLGAGPGRSAHQL